VIDLSAGPVRYGKVDEVVGAVDYESYPRLVEYFQPDNFYGTSLQGSSPV
jgi:hypothetical protein